MPESTQNLEVTLLEILSKGGIMMVPLAILSLICLGLIFLYFLTIHRNAIVSNRFMRTAEQMLRQGDLNELLSYCQRRNQAIAHITGRTLDFLSKNPQSSMEEVREVAQAEGSRQAGILSQRVTYLADIGSIAPMIGLLGTVIGMIKAFLEISQGNTDGVQQMELSSGISEALVTTASGLVIGITALVFYSIFRARVQRYISELESASTHIMALIHSLTQRKKAQETQGSIAPATYQPRNPSPTNYSYSDHDLPPPAHL